MTEHYAISLVDQGHISAGDSIIVKDYNEKDAKYEYHCFTCIPFFGDEETLFTQEFVIIGEVND